MGEAAKIITAIADMAEAIAWQAGVGGLEVAGMIVSYLAANPDRIDHVMAKGVFDEPDMWLNGRLTWHAANGGVITPERARLMRVVKSLEGSNG